MQGTALRVCLVVVEGEHRGHPWNLSQFSAHSRLGRDIVELPRTRKGNCYAIVFQDFFTKWPLEVPAPDQKSLRIACLLMEQLIPMFGVPEALLSNRGANLLSYLMMDLCASLGICKLNTTSYHPQCNGMVERFN